jgi:hypothetical protein
VVVEDALQIAHGGFSRREEDGLTETYDEHHNRSG